MTDSDTPPEEALRGWDSDFVRFAVTPSSAIFAKLRQFLSDALREQVRASSSMQCCLPGKLTLNDTCAYLEAGGFRPLESPGQLN
jgi:hypothetical protein